MSDDRHNRGPEDGRFISLSQPWEVRYWTKALGVSEDRLRLAVQEAGNSAAAVRAHLSAAQTFERANPSPGDPVPPDGAATD